MLFMMAGLQKCIKTNSSIEVYLIFPQHSRRAGLSPGLLIFDITLKAGF